MKLFTLIDHQKKTAPKYSLDSLHAYFQANPRITPPKIITIGGTNGKGSTAYTLSMLLSEVFDYRVGTFTSPHLNRPNERIAINLNPISDSDFNQVLEQVQTKAKRIGQIFSSFELLFLVACEHFNLAKLDYWVMEIGLGGRLDAVNALAHDLSIITHISQDHQAQLGNHLSSIALEKLGIGRSGRPLILGESMPSCIKLLANKRNFQTFERHRDFDIHFDSDHQNATFTLNGQPSLTFKAPSLPLTSLACSLSALSLLGQSIQIPAIIPALERLQLKGRFECVRQSPPIILDVAHNIGSARNLVKALSLFEKTQPVAQWEAIFSTASDKDVASICRALDPIISHWYLLPLPYKERSMDIDAFAKKTALPETKYSKHSNLPSALKAFHTQSSNTCGLVVFGSFHLLEHYYYHKNLLF